MIEITERALAAIRAAIGASHEPARGLRIGAEANGCGRRSYFLRLAAGASPGDLVMDYEGTKLFVDESSLSLLRGTTLDYVVGSDGSGFSFEDPNTAPACSCGRSFC